MYTVLPDVLSSFTYSGGRYRCFKWDGALKFLAPHPPSQEQKWAGRAYGALGWGGANLRASPLKKPLYIISFTSSLLYTCTSWTLYTFSALTLYTCTAWKLYTCTAWTLYTCTAWKLYTCTAWTQYTCTFWTLYTCTAWVKYTCTVWTLHTCTVWTLVGFQYFVKNAFFREPYMWNVSIKLSAAQRLGLNQGVYKNCGLCRLPGCIFFRCKWTFQLYLRLYYLERDDKRNVSFFRQHTL